MALRIPSPKALTKPEAYLAYKAGILSRDELKQNLYNPLNNYEGWLAKWCGLLETYPTNDDGTPQCLTDEEGLLAYLCGVTDRYPASNSRPDDARISAYIRYLVSARYIRPDHPLNREEFYLSLIKTQVVPSGDPSSDITIDGTAKAPFVDVKMYGDTFQQTYTGKNLFATPAGDSSSGVTFTLNPDGTYDISGTATAQTQIVLYISSPWPWLENGETYTIKANQPLGDVMARVEAFSEEAYLRTNYILDSTTQQQTGTWNGENVTKCCFVLRVESGKTVNISGLGIQLEKGSTATSFEKFVGGQPSPNPDYPQPIQTVTGEQTVTVTGKNLLDIQDNLRASDSGLNFSFSNNELTVSGTPTRGWANVTSNISVSLPAGQYTLSLSKQLTYRVYLHIVYTDSTSSDSFIINAGQTSTTITLAKDVSTIRLDFSLMNAGVRIDESFSLQLEAGSTFTDYTPYSKQTYFIDLGSIELCKIGTYQDYIYKDGDDWKVHKATTAETLNGSEDWAKDSSGGYQRFNIIRQNAVAPSGRTAIGLSSHFTSKTTDGIGIFFLASTSSGAIKRFYFYPESNITTVEGFKSWLNSNKTTLVYPLATPTDTVITDQNLIDQLNALKQGGAEEGTTYIKVSATDPNLPAKLYVEAPKYD